MSSRLSVILVVKNGAPFFRAALESVRAQTLPPDEIIVVDGCSTDGSPEIARALGARVLVQQDDGLPNARNLGIAHSSGDYIAFLDADDLWAPTKLELQQQAMETDATLAYTTTLVQFLVQDDALPEWRSRAETEFTRAVPTTSALLARREFFQQVGVFDPSYALSCDPELFTRARDAHVPTLTLPHVLTYKRLHGKNLSNRPDLTRHYMFRVARDSIARQKRAAAALTDV